MSWIIMIHLVTFRISKYFNLQLTLKFFFHHYYSIQFDLAIQFHVIINVFLNFLLFSFILLHILFIFCVLPLFISTFFNSLPPPISFLNVFIPLLLLFFSTSIHLPIFFVAHTLFFSSLPLIIALPLIFSLFLFLLTPIFFFSLILNPPFFFFLILNALNPISSYPTFLVLSFYFHPLFPFI